jgi:hypothetical protein
MLSINEIKAGDYFKASNDGDVLTGEVTQLKKANKEVCLNIGVQEFWYEVGQLSPIPLSEQELKNLRFGKEILLDGTVKYLKGAFRMRIPAEGDFSKMELWYRDEHRHIQRPLFVHELQNHFYEMTKVHLNDQRF